MAVVLIVLGIGVFVWFAWRWRTTTLTRDCRWRLDRTAGPAHWRCAACGAETDMQPGREPRACLKPRP